MRRAKRPIDLELGLFAIAKVGQKDGLLADDRDAVASGEAGQVSAGSRRR